MLDLSSPETCTFDILDIAHNLARVCRFGGAVDEYYSVASHSVYVARELERAGHGACTVRSGLLHDAAEAYLGDMTSGLKRLMPEYRALEHRFNRAIEDRFYVLFAHDAAIKMADLRARLAEVRDLFVACPYPRELLVGGEGDLAAYETPVRPATPDEAEFEFLSMAARLGFLP